METLVEKIEQYHRQLNCSQVVDGRWYRRNMHVYELVTYVNHIIALFLSENYENIPIFIDRAFKYLESEYSANLSQQYQVLVRGYLEVMASWLKAQLCVLWSEKDNNDGFGVGPS